MTAGLDGTVFDARPLRCEGPRLEVWPILFLPFTPFSALRHTPV